VGTSGRSPRADSELAGGEVSGNQGFRGPIRVAKQDVVGSLQVGRGYACSDTA
jgi:hypothetical protein